jgi:hypothetical protein
LECRLFGDDFRIQIRDHNNHNNVVFEKTGWVRQATWDNTYPQLIQGGSIVIHKGLST